MVGQLQSHRWRAAERRVNFAEIVRHNEQADSVPVIF